MTRALTALCFSLLFAIQANAQKVHFSDTTNHWQSWYKFYNYPPSIHDQFYSKDSVVHDTLYRMFSGQWFEEEDTSTRFLIREDTALGRVYVRAYRDYHIMDSNEVLLYDYSLVVGDTVRWGCLGFVDTVIYRVAATDYVEMFGAWHKVWKLETFGGLINYWYPRVGTIIEGVGCMGGPFIPIIRPRPFEEDFELLCFHRNGVYPTIFPELPSYGIYNMLLSDCTEPYSVRQIGNTKSRLIDVFPVPAKNQIEWALPAASYRFAIKNCLGQVVEEWNEERALATKDITKLEPGLYWLLARCSLTGRSYCGKFVKQ